MYRSTRQAVSFAQEQVRCGADFIGVGDAVASLISPAMYEEFVLPYEQELIRAIHGAGARVKLHICGNITAKLPLIAQTGADIVDCDHMVSMERAAAVLPAGCVANGNIDPVEFLSGSPQRMEELVRQCAAVPGVMVSSGCEIPRDTDPQNVKHMVETLRRCGATFEDGAAPEKASITKADLLEKGLIGPGSAQKRQQLLQKLSLPEHLTANAMLETLNLLLTREEFDRL